MAVSSFEPELDRLGWAVGSTDKDHPEPIVVIEEMPALLRSSRGIVAFDGFQVLDKTVLRYAEVGNNPRVKTLGGLHIIQSELGVFVLHDDLSLHQVRAFPVADPWPHEVSIDFVEAWQSYVIVDSQLGTVHVSKDMQSFTKVASDERVTGVVGILPKPASVLAIGEGRLLAITEDCDS